MIYWNNYIQIKKSHKIQLMVIFWRFYERKTYATL